MKNIFYLTVSLLLISTTSLASNILSDRLSVKVSKNSAIHVLLDGRKALTFRDGKPFPPIQEAINFASSNDLVLNVKFKKNNPFMQDAVDLVAGDEYAYFSFFHDDAKRIHNVLSRVIKLAQKPKNSGPLEVQVESNLVTSIDRVHVFLNGNEVLTYFQDGDRASKTLQSAIDFASANRLELKVNLIKHNMFSQDEVQIIVGNEEARYRFYHDDAESIARSLSEIALQYSKLYL
ncbi:MAG: hypothetical protein H6625_06995 [Bdellovibrionaceae bacterium]|nr:hypothetical protein [Pseudobdellovibrionaceae bacterium]